MSEAVVANPLHLAPIMAIDFNDPPQELPPHYKYARVLESSPSEKKESRLIVCAFAEFIVYYC